MRGRIVCATGLQEASAVLDLGIAAKASICRTLDRQHGVAAGGGGGTRRFNFSDVPRLNFGAHIAPERGEADSCQILAASLTMVCAASGSVLRSVGATVFQSVAASVRSECMPTR